MDVEGSLTVPSTGAEQGCDQNYHYSQPAESHSALTDETVLTMTAALLLRGAIGQQENVVLRLRIPVQMLHRKQWEDLTDMEGQLRIS